MIYKSYLSYKSLIQFNILILCYFNTITSQIYPDAWRPNDEINRDDIAFPNEKYHFIVDAFLVSNLKKDEGYRDERHGIYYEPYKLCDNNNNLYGNWPLTPQSVISIMSDSSQYLNQLYINGYQNTPGDPSLASDCYIKVLHDNPNVEFTMTLKFRNTSDEDSTTELYFFGPNYSAFHLITILNIVKDEVYELKIKFKRNIQQIEYRLSTDNFAALEKTPIADNYYDNTNYSNYSFGIRFIKEPNDRTNGDIALMSYLLTSQLLEGMRSTSGSASNSCSFGRKCISNTYCDTATNTCKKCDSQCLDCFSSSANSCYRCFPTSKDFDQFFKSPSKCTFDYVDLSKYDDIKLENRVPPNLNFRFTFETWVWVHNTINWSNSLYTPAVTVVYKDFFTLGIVKNTNPSNLDVYCFPLEHYYKYNINNKKESEFNLYRDTNFLNVKDTYTNISSKWFNIRCAYSIDHNEMYINNSTPINMTVPIFLQGYNDFPYFFKKFYRQTTTYTSLFIQGHSNLNTSIYFKNMYFFNEYLPQSMSFKWWDLTLISSYIDFPNLLFILPFNDLVQDGITAEAETSLYDYSNLTNSPLYISKITIKFISDNLIPPKNFKRLKLLPLNKIYSNTDLNTFTDIVCDTTNSKYCFDDNKAFSCLPGFYLLLNFKCNKTCNTGYTRLPLPNGIYDNGICNYPCPNGVNNCPQSNLELLDINNSFTCDAGFLVNYYKCESDSNANINDNSLHFSGTLNNHSIQITLPSPLSSIILSIWMHPDLTRQTVPPDKESYLFLTDRHQVYYNKLELKYKLKILNNASALSSSTYTDHNLNTSIYYYGWNHIILYHYPSTSDSSKSSIYFGFDNNFFRKESYIGDYDKSNVSQICFCNIETAANCCGISSPITWMEMFYKKLRIFDGTKINVWSVMQFETFSLDNPKSILFYFPFTIETIQNDTLTDILTGLKSTISWDNNVPNYNIDLSNSFNFGYNFSWNDKNPGKFANYVLLTGSTAVPAGNDNCHTACKICYGVSDSQCLSCNSGYGLIGSTCKKDKLNGELFYFKNPPSLNPTKTSLNVSKFGGFNSLEAITVFFFIKLFGFKAGSTTNNILIFDSITNFKLIFEESDESLRLVNNGVDQYVYPYFQAEYIGKWIPISIAAYKSNNPSLYPYMSSFTIHYKTLSCLDLPYKKLDFKEITIPNEYIGYISDLYVYNNFIINALGFASHYTSHESNLKYVVGYFPLKGNSNSNCLSDIDLEAPLTTFSIGLVCASDYNPYNEQNCNSDEGVFVDADNLDAVSCEKCVCSNQCISKMDKCDQKLVSCDNKDMNFIEFLLYLDPDNDLIYCGNHNGLDFNRYENAIIPNVNSPKEQFKLEFWYYTQSYVNNINFDSLIVVWDFHIKLKAYFNPISNNFEISCIPIPDYTKPSNDGTSSGAIHGPPKADPAWRYIVCGVDYIKKVFYASNGYLPGDTNFNSVNVIPPYSEVDLFITETSTTSYGITYIREMRLWNCYDCKASLGLSEYNFNDPLFFDNEKEKVLNVFQFLNPNGLIYDELNPNLIDSTKTKTELKQRSDYKGSNIIKTIPNIAGGGANEHPTGKPPSCYEENHYYYDLLKSYACDKMYNLNRIDDFTFKDIPSVHTGRYAVDFWLYVQDANDFLYGMNIIYDNHLSINFHAETKESKDLIILCFPQGYRDNIKDLPSYKIVEEVYYNSQNKIKDAIDTYSKWIYIKCGYNAQDGVYYLNNKHNIRIKPELYFNNVENSTYLKYYMPEYSNLTVQHANKNYTRIFLQTINIYREYIPTQIDLRHRDMKHYIGPYYYPLVFSVNFNDYSEDYLGLQYYYNYIEKKVDTYTYLYYWLINAKSIQYPDYLVYERPAICHFEYYYDPISKSCLENTITPCDNTKTFCLNSQTEYFFCEKGLFLDVLLLSCNSDCPLGYSRYPDSSDESGICSFECSKYGYIKCPNKNKALKNLNYIDSYLNDYDSFEGTIKYNENERFECKESHYDIYYKCQSYSYKFDNYFMFNNKYSFINHIADYYDIINKININQHLSLNSIKPKYLNQYLIEVWFKIDYNYPVIKNNNTKSKDNKESLKEINHLTYLLVYPHAIVQDLSDLQYKYTNYKASKGKEYSKEVLSNLKLYEWNRIIIENILDEPNYTYIVNIYVNNNLIKPDIQMNFRSNLYDMTVKGIGFCNNIEVDTCSFDGHIIYTKWGSAYYKNIKIYKLLSASKELIISNNNFNSYSDNNLLKFDRIQGLYSYMNLNLSKLYKNKIEDISFPGDFDLIKKNNFDYVNDNDKDLNYALYNAFDPITPGLYYKEIKSNNYKNYTDTAVYSTGKCYDNKCDRCFDDLEGNCYECSTGYIILRGSCILANSFYLRLPLSENTQLETLLNFNTEDLNFKQNLSKILPNNFSKDKDYLSYIPAKTLHISPISIFFWLKFFGIIREGAGNNPTGIYTILGLFDEKEGLNQSNENVNFLGWDTNTDYLGLYYNKNKIAFEVQDTYKFVGKWVHIGISINNAIPEDIIIDISTNKNIKNLNKASFPNMLNLMVDKKMISNKLDFNIKDEYFYINKLSLGNQFSALITKLEIYNQYFIGSYGFAQYSIDRNQTLISNFKFYGNSDINCLSNSDLLFVDINKLSRACMKDTNEFTDSTYECKQFEEIKIINSLVEKPSCLLCNNLCDNYCYDKFDYYDIIADRVQSNSLDLKKDSLSKYSSVDLNSVVNNKYINKYNRFCSCTYDQKKYWIRKEYIKYNKTEYFDYYCEVIPATNIAYYKPIYLENIKPGGVVYNLEAWIYIGEYRNNTFPGGDILWDKFSRIKLEKSDNADYLIKVKCYPYADIDFINTDKTFFVTYEDELKTKVGNWFYVKCATNLGENTVSVNDKDPENIFLNLPLKPWTDNTKLLLRDYPYINESYGVFMVRELRLYNGPLYLFYDTSRIRLDPTIYNSLAHYFINSFDYRHTKIDKMFDSKNTKYYDLEKAEYIKGYNYIEDVKNLTLCSEGETYDEINDFCKELTLEDLLNSIDLGKVYQASELIIRAKTISSLTSYDLSKNSDIDYSLYQNMTIIYPNLNTNKLIAIDPNKDKTYCKLQGDPLIVDRFLSCSCFNGFAGNVCHVSDKDYSTLLKIYRRFATKIWQTALIDQSKVILDSILITIIGADRIVKDTDWLNDMLFNVTKFYDDINYREINLQNTDYFNKIFNSLYTAIINKFNIIKAQTIKAKFPGGAGPRNIDINYVQKYNFKEALTMFRKSLMNLIQRIIIYHTINEVKYDFQLKDEYIFKGLYYKFIIKKIDHNFDFEDYFVNKLKFQKTYEPFFNSKNCFKRVSKRVFYTENYDFWMVYIIWKAPPFIFEETLYKNYTSPAVTLKLFLPNGDEIRVDGCDKQDEIIFYNPLNNPVIIDTVNAKRKLLIKENFIPYNSNYFTDPIYIDDNTGKVYSNLTRDMRIELNYTEFYMVYNYFDINEETNLLSNIGNSKSISEDINENSYGAYYNNFTYDYGYLYYFVSNSSHLTDFILNYKLQKPPADQSSRFYFINRYVLFKYLPNYYSNYGLFISLFIIIFFILFNAICYFYENSKLNKKAFRDLIEEQFLLYIFPYGNLEEEYDPEKEAFKSNNKNVIKMLIEANNNDNINDIDKLKQIDKDISINNDNKINRHKVEEIKATSLKELDHIKEDKEIKECSNSNISITSSSNNSNSDEVKPNINQMNIRKKLENNEIDPYNINNQILTLNKIPKLKKEKNLIKKEEENKTKETKGNLIDDFDLPDNDIEEVSEKNTPKTSQINDKLLLVNNNFINKEDKIINKIKINNNNKKKQLKKRKIFQQNLLYSNKEQRLEDLKNLNISCYDFFISNLKNRHLIYSTIVNSTQFYIPLIRITLLTFYLSIVLLFVTLGVLVSPELVVENNNNNSIYRLLEEISQSTNNSFNYVYLLVWMIIPTIIANIFVYILVWYININISLMRHYVITIRVNYDTFIKSPWIQYKKKRRTYIYLITFITLIFWLSGFYFSFGFCAVYSYQSYTFLLIYITNILVDAIFLEVLTEFIISIIFVLKNKSRCMLKLLDFLNRLRSYKTLSA